jgi:hypothetical protein
VSSSALGGSTILNGSDAVNELKFKKYYTFNENHAGENVAITMLFAYYP